MPIQEIRVGIKEGVDPRASILQKDLNKWGIGGIEKVQAATVYRFEGISQAEAGILAREALTDPITQKAVINTPLFDDKDKRLEIGYKPGVMNPASATLQKDAEFLGIHSVAATSSTEYYLTGDVSDEKLKLIGERLISQEQEVIWQKPQTLLIKGTGEKAARIPISVLSEADLRELSDKRRLFLNTSEMRVIQDYFAKLGREPTDVELETLAQTWSEHNGHKTFKAKLIEAGKEKLPLIQRIRKTAEQYFDRVGVVTAFADNAGGIRFYDGQVIIAKGETHNSPVAVEPYGGSLTKNGGVYRDIAGCGQGGINLVGLMVNCFGYPDAKPEDIPAGTLHPKNLLLENSHGERDYGNRMGIPTHSISLHFHPDFGPKPTSMGIVVGIIPEDRVEKGQPQAGDYLISVGGKTGRDGIHGATFSSGEMTASTSSVDATAVQIGNAIEEKRMFDALIEARDADLIRAITDCGGGGYSSAIGEIAEDVGVAVDLSYVPLKYEGLAPWEIWLSEAQERMVVALSPKNWEEFKKICDRFDTPSYIIGSFTGDRILTLKYDGKLVGHLAMEFLHKGLPQRVTEIKNTPREENDDLPSLPVDWVKTIKEVLGNLNVASKEEMLRQYDQSVQGRTVLYPFSGVFQDIPNDASVIAPLYGKPYGVVTTHALNPLLNRINPYEGSLWALAEAASKYTAVGGNIHEAAMIDNFVWPKPTPQYLDDLDQSVTALCEMMDVLEIPVVSGKDSLSSTYTDPEDPEGKVINIPPVLNITIFGKIPDVGKTVSADIKSNSSTLVMVGNADVNHLGGSIYFQANNIENTQLPWVDLENLPQVLQTIFDTIQSGKVRSCKAIGEGGIITTIIQMCFGGDCGVNIDIGKVAAKRADFALFNETAGCFVVEVESEEEAKELFNNVPYSILGKTTKERIIAVSAGEEELFTADLYDLKEAWQRPMKEVLS